MGITWTHTKNDASGNPIYEWVDDATGKPYDVEAAKAFAKSVTPSMDGGGYSMNDYMAKFGDSIANYMYDTNDKPLPAIESGKGPQDTPAYKAEEERRAKAAEAAKNNPAWFTTPGTPGPNRLTGDKNRPWAWKAGK